MDMQGKAAIVTGGAQGIGREIALCLAKKGTNIVVGDINYEEAKVTVSQVEALGVKALAIDVDISSPNQVEHLIARTKGEFGSIDILINNAAYVKKIKFLDYSVEEWNKIVNVCINGYFYCTQFAAKEMEKTGGGAIINISSMVGMIAHGGLTAYAASKAAVISMTKLAAMELKKYNITVNAIAPGPVDTPLMKNVMGKMSLGKTGMVLPAAAIGKAEDIGEAAVWLLSVEDNRITGNVIDLGAALIG